MHLLEALEGRLELKFFAKEDGMPSNSDFVSVFHRWIQTGSLSGELLIDIADYSHVHHGPGVVLVGHEAFYAIDQADGRPGLLCRPRRFVSRDGRSRLLELFRRGLRARILLQEEPAFGGRLRFRDDEMRLRIHDRRFAPNQESTFTAIERELGSILEELGGAGVRLEALAPSTGPFTVRIELGTDPNITLCPPGGSRPHNSP